MPMSKNKDKSDDSEGLKTLVSSKLKILEARQSTYFARLQSIYKATLDVAAPESRECFLTLASNVTTLRQEYLTVVEEICVERMALNPSYEPNLKTWDSFEDMYAIVKRVLDKIGSASTPVGALNVTTSNLKLPPITLLKFDGNTNEWPSFIECFNYTIHHNRSLSNSEKVYYLCGQLSGKAWTAIAGIAPTGENYELIYTTLVDKYQDVRSLATAYLDQAFTLAPLTCASVDGLNHFLDKFTTAIAALEKLSLSDKKDFMYLYMALKKIDQDTVRLFENSIHSDKIPTYEDLIKFVKNQTKILERTGPMPIPSTSTKPASSTKLIQSSRSKAFVTTGTKSNNFCSLCNTTEHETFDRCSVFMRLSPQERFNIIKRKNCCVFCLSLNHKTASCTSNKGCDACQSTTHHTLLHFPPRSEAQKNALLASVSMPPASGIEPALGCSRSDNCAGGAEARAPAPCAAADGGGGSASGVTHLAPFSVCSLQTNIAPMTAPTTVLLATARVRVVDRNGTTHVIRALIDNGAQNDFITLNCCKRLCLKLKPLPGRVTVNGFGGASNIIQGMTTITIGSRFNSDVSYELRPLVVDSITDQLPTSPVDTSILSYLGSVPLADDTFSQPGEVEMLFGAQLFPRLLQTGRVQGPPGTPVAFQTPLGFILMGEAPMMSGPRQSFSRVFCATTGSDIDTLLRRFWELENITSTDSASLKPEDQECEEIYRATTTRDNTGRYQVALPFKQDPSCLGNSIKGAQKRFLSLERKLQASSAYRTEYDNILGDYLEKGYIIPVGQSVRDQSGYIIPHHGVVRTDKVSTKVRLVLDASSRTDNNVSLNQLLHTGENLQSDLFALLLNFRLFPIAFSADVKQMYLQIKVHPQFHQYQRILYRYNPSDPLEIYEFTRVCFGLASSPYLALRTLKQLAEDEGSKFPRAAEIIESGHFYMDDIVHSSANVPEAVETTGQLSKMFAAGGFDLLKWSSNSPALLDTFSTDQLHPHAVDFEADSSQKVLGIKWEPREDQFCFELSLVNATCTKRNMLSVIARLWDVLGFAAPVILHAKLLIKELWLLKIDWDDQPPQSIVDQWATFQGELNFLTRLTIPRHIGVTDSCIISLLAFADASEKAYGAVIYVHVQTPNDDIKTRLLCAKSKVAPVQTVSLARLELCAIHLMSKLVRTVRANYSKRCIIDRVFAFSDSTVALSWVNSSPHNLKTFVANRVAKIQEILSPECFFHVSGKENPSDCLSRGLLPSQLINHPLWLRGPSWTNLKPDRWPIQTFKPDGTIELPDVKVIALPATSLEESPILKLAGRISRWPKLLRIVAYVLRFAGRLKTKDVITAEDLEVSELVVLRQVQEAHFASEAAIVREGRSVPATMKKLRPFIDNDLLRVGGRLANSDLEYDHKHPILLPNKEHVVNLLVDHVHKISCHAGPQHLMSILRHRYWILSARRLVRARVFACVPCFKIRPKPMSPPLMAGLSECRLRVSKPFANTGVDYCGPIRITLTRKRGCKSQKAYMVVLICLTTRAVHVEIAPDLTTEAFLNAFKRFLSRRGPVERLYSDNGTNFVGARRYLTELQTFVNSSSYTDEFRKELAQERINWTMIVPNAPHFGGSWESLVKSFKTHLFRAIGSQLLCYDEMLTLLCQIEAVLNSRPLGILSEDPSEPLPLTPAHFLNTRPMRSFPAAEITEEHQHLLSRYLLLDKLVQSYWRRWRDEYLHTLQERSKWNTESRPAEVGTIVLIMQDNSPPLHWPLGVIEETFPGRDGRTRVAVVRTKSGTFKRPIIRLCPLPIIQ